MSEIRPNFPIGYNHIAAYSGFELKEIRNGKGVEWTDERLYLRDSSNRLLKKALYSLALITGSGQKFDLERVNEDIFELEKLMNLVSAALGLSEVHNDEWRKKFEESVYRIIVIQDKMAHPTYTYTEDDLPEIEFAIGFWSKLQDITPGPESYLSVI